MIKLVRLLRRLGRSKPSRRTASLPEVIWGTKGFEFWTFLSLLLAGSNCSKLLELGSGRSTLTLAEYAKFRNAELTSIETSEEWFNKVQLDLRSLCLPRNPVHLLKLDLGTGWYDCEEFRRLTRKESNFDFVLVDGPNDPNGQSQNMRDSESAVQEIPACTANADIVLVDDVHRKHVLDTVDRMLVDPTRYEKWFYDYVVHHKFANSLCICARQGSTASAEIQKIQNLLQMPLYRTFDRQRCSED
jgi:predicted O-methyltransferase YrrM